MATTLEHADAAMKEQIGKPEATLSEAVDDAAKARDRVAAISQQYGGPALDIGTGPSARLAVAIAHRGVRVTAVDHAPVALAIAEDWTAEELSDCLEVRYAEATHLPFSNGAYRVVAAFDALCHTTYPPGVLAEMFRVCADDGVVIITELNSAGRKITRHRDDGFETRLPELLVPHCQDCQRVNDAYHITFVCTRESHVRT